VSQTATLKVSRMDMPRYMLVIRTRRSQSGLFDANRALRGDRWWWRQVVHRRSVIADRQVRVHVHGEVDVAVSGQSLSDLGLHARLAEVRDERVPVGVEVGEEPIFILVRYARSLQVPPHHLRGLAKVPALRLEREEQSVGVDVAPGGQPFPQPVHDRRVKRDAVLSSPLAVTGLHADDGRGIVQVEGTERQRGDLLAAVAGPGCENVQHRPVRACDPFDGRPVHGGFDEPVELVGAQRAPVVPAVSLRVLLLHVCDRVISPPAVLHEPATECHHRSQVVVAGFDAPPFGSQVGQECLDRAGGDVADESKFAPACDGSHAISRVPHVFGRVALVAEVLLEIVDVIFERTLPMLFITIDNPNLA